MEKLVSDILSKRELQNLDEDIVNDLLKRYFQENSALKKILDKKEYNPRSTEYKQVVKEIRKTLREIYGVFIQKGYSKRETFLEELTKENTDDQISKILNLHQSTKERLPYYKTVYKKLFEITGNPKIILDLACGLNPVSYPWLKCNPKYIASDISKKDMVFLESFFSKINVSGLGITIDLVKEQDKLASLKADVCFLFKTLDSLETRKRNISKNLIEKINAKWIVVSFSKVSLGGEKIIEKKKRNWFFNHLKQKNLHYQEFEVPNEYFIVIKKFLD
ncbi:MAG: hypothetical protein ABIB43_04440 [archaeon]